MKTIINHHLFTQTTLDSGSLTMLGSIISTLSKVGEYEIAVLRGEQVKKIMHLIVDDNCKSMQLNIDLAAPKTQSEKNCGCKKENSNQLTRFALNPQGHVLFYVSRGSGGYWVSAGMDNKKVFDSRQLNQGDIFVANLIRPGTYLVTNTNTQANGKIVVAYPETGKLPFRQSGPVEIECTEVFNPDKIEIQPSQGQIYRIKSQSRIKIELVKPDNGPAGADQPRAIGWRKPSSP